MMISVLRGGVGVLKQNRRKRVKEKLDMRQSVWTKETEEQRHRNGESKLELVSSPAELEYAFVKEMGAGVEGEVGDKRLQIGSDYENTSNATQRFGLCGDRCSLVNSCARHCFRPWKYSREQENRNSYSHGALVYFLRMFFCFSLKQRTK